MFSKHDLEMARKGTEMIKSRKPVKSSEELLKEAKTVLAKADKVLEKIQIKCCSKSAGGRGKEVNFKETKTSKPSGKTRVESWYEFDHRFDRR